MRITIRDIAEKTGVSVAAVSLAINNKPGVGDETRKNIIRVAEELGYEFPRNDTQESNLTVRFLKISRHGHTVNKSHNFFIDAYFDGIASSASESEAVLEVETYTANEPLEKIIQRINESPQITGYLILGTELSTRDINSFLDTGKNIVFMDTFIDYIPADFVDMNNTDAVFKVIKHFTGNGHDRIGLIKSSVNTRNFYLREKAYYEVMESAGLRVNSDYIIDVDSTFDTAYSDFSRYLAGKPELPSAFFVINDIIAMGCMRALQEAGYEIPGDVSLAGFDNLPMAEMVSPQLTTIDVSKKEIGQTAFDMLLLKAARSGNRHPTKTLIGGNLIERQSVRNLTG